MLSSMTPDERRRAYTTLRGEVPRGGYKRSWLHWWVVSYLGVWIPAKKVCEDHSAPFTAFADAFFGETWGEEGRRTKPVNVVVGKASRLFGGKSMLSAVLGLTRCILLGAEVKILGGSKEQSVRVQSYLKNTDEKVRGLLMEYKRAPKNQIASVTATVVKFTNGGSVEALAASERSTRGPHPTDLLVDEVDECEWDVFSSALGQTKEARGIKPMTFISSTEQNADGSMAEVMEMAEARETWKLHTWCLHETHEGAGGHITQTEVERKQDEMTELDWRNEVLLQRPESGDLIFSQEVIDFLFDPRIEVPAERLGTAIALIPPDHPDGGFYTGGDWAKTRDKTCIPTMQEKSSGPDELACYIRMAREPWPNMIGAYNERVSIYGGPAMHDATGLGSVMADYLTVEAVGWNFSNRKASHEMFSSYVAACESGKLVLPPIPSLKKAHEKLTRKQLYGSSQQRDAHLPDEISAMSMARKAKLEGAFDILIGRAN